MPTRLQDLNDSDFGTLNNSKNKNIVRYNSSTNKFNVVQIDSALGFASSIPQSFTNIVQDKIDIANIGLSGIDGGSF